MVQTPPDEPSRVFDYVAERIARGLGEPVREREEGASVDGDGGPPHPPGMDDSWRTLVDARLSRLEGSVAGLKGSVDGVRWVVGILTVVMIGGFGFLGFQ